MAEQAEGKENSKPRDNWDKADILLRFIGAVGTAVVLAFIGFFGSHFLALRQEAETDLRLYTELMSKREESDTSLRREMFDSIIATFLTPAPQKEPDSTEKMVLNLELLAYNFHDSLDLAPLFKDVHSRLSKDPNGNKKEYVERLKKVTLEVIAKQVATLAEAGGKRDGNIAFSDLLEKPQGVSVISDLIAVKSTELPDSPTVQKQISVEALSVDTEKQEVKVRLIVRTQEGVDETDEVFNVGFFDFPMLDNVRLPQGHRCAIVLNEFDGEPEDGSASLTFVYFPSSRASLKEKTYYDEILATLRKAPTR